MNCPKCNRVMVGRTLWCSIHGDLEDICTSPPTAYLNPGSYPRETQATGRGSRGGRAHGTVSSYNEGCHCQPCTKAKTEYQRELRVRGPRQSWSYTTEGQV